MGTFPLGAYQYLLDWHLKWYAGAENEPDKWASGRNPAIFQTKDGYQLTTAKKKEILLNNIFGVDNFPARRELLYKYYSVHSDNDHPCHLG